MRTFNSKVADDSIQIKNHQVQTGWGSAPALDLFLTFVESIEMIFSQYKESCEVLLDDPKIGGENIKELKIGH